MYMFCCAYATLGSPSGEVIFFKNHCLFVTFSGSFFYFFLLFCTLFCSQYAVFQELSFMQACTFGTCIGTQNVRK